MTDSSIRRLNTSGAQPAGLADVLDRVLDKGLVVAGDIGINLLDIEVLTIKVRLILASADKAEELGIDWWRTDPYLSSEARNLDAENRTLRERLGELEDRIAELGGAERSQLERGSERSEETGDAGQPTAEGGTE